MSVTPGAIVRRGGISRTVFVISLIVVAAASGLTGYFLPGLLKPGTTTITINGDGATFPFPFLSAVAANYTSSHSNIHINYQAVGSTQGVTDFTSKIVDFAASDRPMTDTQRGNAPNALHIPEVVGAVAIAYRVKNNSANAPLPKGLVISNDVAAQIFDGSITYWNDSRIKAINPTFAPWLPGDNLYGLIKLVVRGDGSGTAFIFSSYLNQSSQWPHSSIPPATLPNWPSNTPGGLIQAQGNAGVASVVQRTYGTIGFVELNYAISATPPITYAFVVNIASSNPIEPTLASVADAVANPPVGLVYPNGNASWSKVSLINSPDPQAYPITGLTYVLVYQELSVLPGMTQAKATALVDFLWFLIHTGQNQAAPLSYSTLPSAVVTIDENSINAITFNGVRVHT
jgi:phosphate transport system substrate-binding protein